MASGSDSHHTLPYDDADDPLISRPEKSPRPPVAFDSREQLWWNIIALSGRCLTTALSLSFLILGLLVFSRLGELSKKEQYVFNTITILLSAFASLGLGSMLGHLGSMLRWRLLARKKYKMQDIELLLSMPSPSGSAALLFTHFREWRFSLTTFIVMSYLLVNIIGRFSVAIFGLTYNLVDDPDVKLPPQKTNWNSTTSCVLLTKDATTFNATEKGPRLYLDLAQGGLITLTQQRDIVFNDTVPLDLTEDTLYTLNINNSTIQVADNNVEFIYNITDFEEEGPIPANHTVHSSASCAMFRLDGNKYWRDSDGGNQTFRDWKDEGNSETIADVLRALNSEDAQLRESTERVTWAAPQAGRTGGLSKTYVVYRETAWECISILWEKQGGDRHPEALFDSASLFLLPVAGGVEPGKELSATVRTTTTKVILGYPSTYTRTSLSKSGTKTQIRVSTGTSTSYSTRYRTATVTNRPIRVGRTASVMYRWFTELQSRANPSAGVQTLNFYQNGTGGSPSQKEYYNLYVAGLVARLPIAAIAYGNKISPRVLKDPKARSIEYVKTTLEVKWDRVSIAAGAIVASQILAIVVVLYYCRNVYIREDSYLANAELLKTVLSKIGDGTLMTGAELESTLDKALGGPVSYGTISGSRGDYLKVALGREVDYNFPGFPPFRKRSIFRR